MVCKFFKSKSCLPKLITEELDFLGTLLEFVLQLYFGLFRILVCGIIQGQRGQNCLRCNAEVTNVRQFRFAIVEPCDFRLWMSDKLDFNHVRGTTVKAKSSRQVCFGEAGNRNTFPRPVRRGVGQGGHWPSPSSSQA